MRKSILYIVLPVLLAGLFACSRSGKDTDFDYEDIESADTLTLHARYLTLADNGGGYVSAEIGNPWDEGKTMARYALVHRDSAIPEGLGNDVAIIRTPVDRAAVYSSVHTSAMDELGVLDALVAVADGMYFAPTDTVGIMLAEGRVADVGQSVSPSVERLAAARPSVVLRSPMEGMAGGKLPASMVPVECVDYMETSPIGRAEWILLMGELFGCRDSARAVFSRVVDDYCDLSLKAQLASSPKPKVLVETEQSGVWYVPAGHSYQAHMLADAGADYPWKDTDGTGSLALSIETVADKAMDADVWLVRSYGYETSPESLRALNPRYASFKALKNGGIYSCNTAERLIFNDMAFHPERVLADYVWIFHPEEMPGYEPRYFIRTGR